MGCAAAFDPLSGLSGVDVVAALRSLGVEYESYPVERTGRSPLADLSALAALFAVTRRHRPDLMVAYTAKAIIWGVLAGWLARVPRRYVLMTGLPHGLGARAKGSGWTGAAARALFRMALSRAHGIIFQNPDDERALRERGYIADGVATVVVNGSGVDLEHFCEAPVPTGPPTFLLVARLLREKGVIEFLEAARQLKRVAPMARFALAGPLDPHPDGVEESVIRAWEREGVGEWLGPLSDVRPTLASCSVFVLPSHHEGTARTVLEAMSTGRAIVTTDAPGCRDTVASEESGLLVPVGDVAALTRAMRRFVDEPALIGVMGARSRERAEARYNVRVVNAAMIAFLEAGRSIGG